MRIQSPLTPLFWFPLFCKGWPCSAGSHLQPSWVGLILCFPFPYFILTSFFVHDGDDWWK